MKYKPNGHVMWSLPSFRDVGWPLQVVDGAEGFKKPWGGPSRGRPTRYVASWFYLVFIAHWHSMCHLRCHVSPHLICLVKPLVKPHLSTLSNLACLPCQTLLVCFAKPTHLPCCTLPHWQWPHQSPPLFEPLMYGHCKPTDDGPVTLTCHINVQSPCQCAMMKSLVSLVAYTCPSHLAPPVIVWQQAYNVTP